MFPFDGVFMTNKDSAEVAKENFPGYVCLLRGII